MEPLAAAEAAERAEVQAARAADAVALAEVVALADVVALAEREQERLAAEAPAREAPARQDANSDTDDAVAADSTTPTQSHARAPRQEAPHTPASPANNQRQRPCIQCRAIFTRNSLKISVLMQEVIEAAAERGNDLRPFSCCICMEVMEQPVTLQCGHTGCQKCLSSIKPAIEIRAELDQAYDEQLRAQHQQ